MLKEKFGKIKEAIKSKALEKYEEKKAGLKSGFMSWATKKPTGTKSLFPKERKTKKEKKEEKKSKRKRASKNILGGSLLSFQGRGQGFLTGSKEVFEGGFF